MQNRSLLLPYFLGDPMPGLLSLTGTSWRTLQPATDSATAAARLVQVLRPLAHEVEAAVRRGERPVSVCGDCCSALGMAAGLERAGCRPTLIWLDAHGDFNTPETSPSGFLGGMPLAMLVGRGEQEISRGLGLAAFPEERVLLTDARALDPGEREAVADSAVTHLGSVEAVVSHLPPDGPLWIHFDVDVVDPSEVPAVAYPTHGGPSADTVARLFRHLSATGRVAAVSVSTWDPEMEGAEASREAAMGLLGELVART